MNTEAFEKVIDKQIEGCRRDLVHKAGEYADAEADDRLHNFKAAAAVQGCTPVTALGGMMSKHTVSVYDLIRKQERGVAVSKELWDEKITDSINYLLLLQAALEEQRGDGTEYDFEAGM